jgi:hypothetical protein
MPKQSFMRKRAIWVSLDKFEELIRDAIALLVKRGEILIFREKRRSHSPASKQKDGDRS